MLDRGLFQFVAIVLAVPIAWCCQAAENDWYACYEVCEARGTELVLPASHGAFWVGSSCPDPCPCTATKQSAWNHNKLAKGRRTSK